MCVCKDVKGLVVCGGAQCCGCLCGQMCMSASAGMLMLPLSLVIVPPAPGGVTAHSSPEFTLTSTGSRATSQGGNRGWQGAGRPRWLFGGSVSQGVCRRD